MSDSILEQIKDIVGGAQYDGYLACLCIFHDDRRPSLIIHEDTYKCLSCGAWGKAKDLLAKLSGMPIKPAPVTDFRNPWSRWLKTNNLAEILQSAYRTNKANPSVYLRDNRKISVECQIHCKIGQRDNWITIPVLDNRGKIVGGVARANESNLSKSKYVVPNDQDGNLLYVPDWSLHTKSRYTFLTFGILDAVTLSMLGYPAISTMSGKRLDPTTLDSWRKQIIFIPDSGEEAEAGKIAAYLGWRGIVWRIDWPNDAKDINDLWTNHSDTLKSELQRKTRKM